MKIFDFRFSIFDRRYRKPSAARCLFLLLYIVSMMVLTGCGPQRQTEEPLCAGKVTVAEAVAALRQKQAGPLSLQAGIQCVMELPNPQGKPENQDFNGKMIFVGPDNLRIGGDKFGPILIGANEKEFWFYVKPGLDTAWWGEKKNVPSCVDKLGVNPFYLAEALGQIDLNRDWRLIQQPSFDILAAPEAVGIKKVYINCCTYQVERIEYTDMLGNLVTSADLSDYRQIPKVGNIPQAIELRHFRSARTDSIVRLRLSGITSFSPAAAQQKLFERPMPKGYKSVYHWTENCEFVSD
jgi:outer membrane lipoprotein-sorting protein